MNRSNMVIVWLGDIQLLLSIIVSLAGHPDGSQWQRSKSVFWLLSWPGAEVEGAAGSSASPRLRMREER